MESKRTRSVSLEERRSSKELLKHRESVCTACHRTHTAHAPPFKRCGRCLLAHYCSRDCQTLDWRTHKHQCTSLAVTGLITKYHAATVAGRFLNCSSRLTDHLIYECGSQSPTSDSELLVRQVKPSSATTSDIEDEHRGMSYTTLFSVVDTAALPEGLTMAQVRPHPGSLVGAGADSGSQHTGDSWTIFSHKLAWPSLTSRPRGSTSTSIGMACGNTSVCTLTYMLT